MKFRLSPLRTAALVAASLFLAPQGMAADAQNGIVVYNAQHENPLDQLRLTNIGAFREYLELWLAHRPDINTQMTHMVRQLQSGPTGLPLEIYCFSAQQEWVRYEQIQSDIFDHVLAIVGQFNLRIFQYSDAPD